MSNESDDLINYKTVAFLKRASALNFSDINLKADLAVNSKKYGSLPTKKGLFCSNCCLSLVPERLTFRVQKRRQRKRVLTSACSYCGKQQIMTSSLRSKTGTKSKKNEFDTLNVLDLEIDEEKDERTSIPISNSQSSIISKSMSSSCSTSSIAPLPSTTTQSKTNSKKRAKTLSKLASLNDDKNRINSGNASTSSPLLAFMNSLKR